ncbi:MAG: T9SS type A sorting domain-containing protein [Flavobacteriales bacterium]|nr:T9SS type A sorting domain-containing protein [Flavobacteriales bacterium]
MRPISTLLALLPLAALAQTLWNVNVGGSTITPNNLPYYSPQNLTITVGDMVRWSNVNGTHNVNGGLDQFPGNPQAFSSGDPASMSWSYQFTFTIPGVYNYHCDSEGHASTQFGSITVVEDNTHVAETEGADAIRVFPSPANEQLTIDLGSRAAQSVRVVNLSGETVATHGGNASGMVTIDISALPAANYFVLITDTAGRMRSVPFGKR